MCVRLPGLTMPAHTCFGYERVGIALTREGRPSLPDRRGEAATVRSPTFRPVLSWVRLVSRVHEAAQPEGIRHHCHYYLKREGPEGRLLDLFGS